MAQCHGLAWEEATPVRTFRWSRGLGHFPGWWWAASTERHVGFESWLEQDRLILLDFDPDVVGIASQPFWLHWHDGKEKRRHAPDYFVRLADGRARVVDVRAEDQVEERTAEAFAATERACSGVGWEFEHVGVPDPALMANLRWLARYRHPRCAGRAEIASRLQEIFAVPTPLLTGAEDAGDRLAVLPALFHLMWRQELVADLAHERLGPSTLVRAAGSVGGSW
ncbi:TnsA-like heteromeric transposase endonuclease subunit [Streptomyces platensis]|uniref:TnsA-like heteromeric transposase endonuclease subunit n=1 Tax=Streptomyces platensis TaxID=58346 RepID=UPI0033F852F0